MQRPAGIQSMRGTTRLWSTGAYGKHFDESDHVRFQRLFEYQLQRSESNHVRPWSDAGHELAHVHPQANGQTLGDGPVASRGTQVGPTETFVNQIRTERGLPHRGPAYEGRSGGFFGNRVLVNFQVGRRIVDVSAREYH
jgi:hypothetical protein